ncbi:hypothetical protein HY792_06785, partial [Candidatus Desantisbacteria bacterium]|nr:hypothetical protein [Candidatus Desantisbacteria bacterium]
MSKKTKKSSTKPISKSSAWYHHLHIPHSASLIFLAAIAIITSLNTLWGEFVYDDTMTILEDKRIQDWHQIFHWTPRHIRTITYIIDYHFWGLNPFG